MATLGEKQVFSEAFNKLKEKTYEMNLKSVKKMDIY